MDIASLKPLEEVEVKISHPVTGVVTDIVFTVKGTYSKEYRQAYRSVLVKNMTKDDSEEKEDEDDQEAEILAKCVVDFKGLLIDGEEPEKTTESIKQILIDYTWIKNQIDVFIAKKSNFFLKA